ncbi:Polyamine oxidase [Colletotrichum trifolii]|uniref:Polyamine oxidase n=1 Tax=Colletotrichum trifolii TaxID=5466 RepID=A0A4R8QT85_COLTR|nr:Polyamine oxidase [Colletotrichum trifolii]
MDFEYAATPETTSQQYSVVNYNTSFYRWSELNNFVRDPEGFSKFVKKEAKTSMLRDDPRLMLNTMVTNISYFPGGVQVHNHDGSCIEADHAVCTFSLGVMQHETVNFEPQLPVWKRTAIQSMAMGTYTKIFMQFKPEDVFWDRNTQFFLYADPVERGYYPIFQSLDHSDFEPGSGIVFVTVVDQQAYRVEAQDDETTKQQIMTVLRRMFGEKIADPVFFLYPRWSQYPTAYGSYSSWPPTLSLEMHQNLRANLDNLWFAGEATHPQYFGFLQGAWYEGKSAGEAIAGCIRDMESCRRQRSYEVLHGNTPLGSYNLTNGWTADAFFQGLSSAAEKSDETANR